MMESWQRKGCFLKLALIIVFTALLIQNGRIFPHVQVKAQESADTVVGKDISMSITYGFENHAKYGRYMRVNADITNSGREFDGWLQVIVPKTSNNVVYRKEIKLTGNTKTSSFLTVPVMDNTGYMQVKILDDEQNTIVEKKIRLKFGNYDKLAYFGILSDEKESLSYLSNYGTQLFYLDENTLPDDYLGLDLLDVIVINHFDTNRLSDEQVEAIKKWVSNGGSLVIGTGEYETETLGKLQDIFGIRTSGVKTSKRSTLGINTETLQEIKQDILDYEENRRIFLEAIKERNESLKAYGYPLIEIDNTVFDRWTRDKISRLTIQSKQITILGLNMENSSTVLEEDRYKLMQSQVSGLGNILLYSMDLGLTDTDTTLGLSILHTIRKNMSSKKLSQLEDEYYGSYSNYGIYNSMSYTDAKNVPKAFKYVLLLLIYICIAGPITYLILKKLDKRSLTWGVVPFLAVLFTFIVYITGSSTRIDKPFLGYVKLLNFQNNKEVKEELYFSLTVPYNQNYVQKVGKGYNITELRENSNNSYRYDVKNNKDIYYDNYATSINYGENGTKLEVNDNPAFSPVYYQSETSYDMENRLTSDIHYIGESIYGSITNGFDFDITNAMLLSDGYIIHIGTIASGESVSLQGKEAVFLTTRDELYNSDIINKVAGGTGDMKDNTVEINRLSNVLYYLTEGNLLNDQHSSCIIGFVQKKGSEAAAEENQNQRQKNHSNGDDSDESDWNKNTSREINPKEYNQSENNSKENPNVSDSKTDLLRELTKNLQAYGTTALTIPVDVDYTLNNRIFVPSIDPYIIISEGYYNKYYKTRYLNSNSMTIEYRLPEEDRLVSFEYVQNRNQESINEYLNAFDGKIYFLNVNTGSFDEVFQKGIGSSVSNVEDYVTDQHAITVRYNTDMSLEGYQMTLPYISYWKEGFSHAADKKSD